MSTTSQLHCPLVGPTGAPGKTGPTGSAGAQGSTGATGAVASFATVLSAHLATDAPYVTGDATNVPVFASAVVDVATLSAGSTFAGGVFTAGVAGSYLLEVTANLVGRTPWTWSTGELYLACSVYGIVLLDQLNTLGAFSPNSNQVCLRGSVLLPLQAGETVTAKCWVGGGAKLVGVATASKSTRISVIQVA